MQAIEFRQQVREGLVKVPSQFQNWNNIQVRVILLAEKIEPTFHAKPEKDRYAFDAVSLKTKNFRFNRDEANER